ncbi:MAG: hypothetical protein IJG15_02525 [Lachnospiraceae bacterium]|nr:hypothetical protein [Lachnospiraceae bacterium]
MIASEKTPPRISPRGAALASGILGKSEKILSIQVFFTQELCAARCHKAPLILHLLALAKHVLPPRKRIRRAFNDYNIFLIVIIFFEKTSWFSGALRTLNIFFVRRFLYYLTRLLSQ